MIHVIKSFILIKKEKVCAIIIVLLHLDKIVDGMDGYMNRVARNSSVTHAGVFVNIRFLILKTRTMGTDSITFYFVELEVTNNLCAEAIRR